LLTTEGSPIKHSREIVNLLKAVFLPKQIAVIHCPGHQRSEDQVSKGNQRADMTAKEATGRPYVQAPFLWEQSLLHSEHPQYSPTEHSQASERGYCLDHRGWWITPEGKLFLPQSSQWEVLKILHQTYHLVVHKTLSLAGQLFEGLKLRYTLQDIIRGCEICQHNNPCNTGLLSLELRGWRHIQGRTGNLTSPTSQGAQPLDCSWFW
jgi:hypothetical protein